MLKAYYHSPIGIIEITSQNSAIHSILFVEQAFKNDADELLNNCLLQLDEYFQGQRKEFSIPYQQEGTAFQQKVWEALTHIPYGQTWSYSDQAKFIHKSQAIRAVGGTNGKNQLTILVPCHRVIGKDGSLTGYGGTLPRKKWLLEHERKFS
ncbi:MAG: methylated-DNA--[protein]-cysteine S-methyltransferase [Candidatus Abawacabacteria bacterium]|nr:methylated-DNA--[protein]-cysteine S-methyltransferase [Candidatus Abawacabacteria bacterium]